MRILLLLFATLTLCQAQTTTIYCNPNWNQVSYWGGTQPFMQFGFGKGNTGYFNPGGQAALLPGQCTGATAGLGPNDGIYARYQMPLTDIVVVETIGASDTYYGQTRPASMSDSGLTYFRADLFDPIGKLMYAMGGTLVGSGGSTVIAFTVTLNPDPQGSPWYTVTNAVLAPPGGTIPPATHPPPPGDSCPPASHGHCIPRSADPSASQDAPLVPAAPAATPSSSSGTPPIVGAWFAGGFVAGIGCVLLAQFILVKHQQRKSTVTTPHIHQDAMATAA